ncbi:MAG: hypothetical protein JSV45_11920 [Chromatiales bacterium]|nr:MAG: hypothetical protein JSV45_11920 [Chromatiales bacterium]
MDWMKIGQAALLIMFIVVLIPAVRWWSKNSPKAEKGDWTAALLPLVGVILFVALLIYMVR